MQWLVLASTVSISQRPTSFCDVSFPGEPVLGSRRRRSAYAASWQLGGGARSGFRLVACRSGAGHSRPLLAAGPRSRIARRSVAPTKDLCGGLTECFSDRFPCVDALQASPGLPVHSTRVRTDRTLRRVVGQGSTAKRFRQRASSDDRARVSWAWISRSRCRSRATSSELKR